MNLCSDEKDRHQKKFIKFSLLSLAPLCSSFLLLSHFYLFSLKSYKISPILKNALFHSCSSFKFLSNLFPSLYCQIFQERMPPPPALLH